LTTIILELGTFAEWLTAIGELGIVLAILHEIKKSRETSFLERSSNQQYYRQRKELYEAFLAPGKLKAPATRAALWRNAHELAQKAWSGRLDGTTTHSTADICDEQTAHLSQIAFLHGNPKFRTRWLRAHGNFLGLGANRLIEWFPHSVVMFWIMMGPYILDRQSKMGRFWARELETYALACAEFILKDKSAQLSLYDKDKTIIIERSVIEQIRDELATLAMAETQADIAAIYEAMNLRLLENQKPSQTALLAT